MSLSVSVFGLGYVGCVSAACFAKEGHSVVGVDISAAKVTMLNAGTSTILETGIGELVAEMVASGRLRATTDVADAVRSSELSLICVGTPSRPNGSIDLSYIERVCTQIGETLKTLDRWHTVVIRSTVLPGTVDGVVIPALERASGKEAGADFGVCSNPEFLREGSSIKDFYAPPFTLIGSHDERSAAAVRAIYAGIDAPVHCVAMGVAETVKYACNSFHAVKVTFANEIGGVCKAVGVDSHEVMRIFCEDTKLNISPAYLRPGFAFGGSCLPKDVRALSYKARQLDVDTPMLAAALESNRKLIERAYGTIVGTGARRIGVLGMSFKAGTDDLRESPIVTLIEMLIGKGMDVAVYDRDVSSANLIGSNREYIEREIPHIWSLVDDSMERVVERSEVVVIGNATPAFRSVEQQLGNGRVVVDLVRAFGDRLSDGIQYHGINW
ncbi:MAG TPA: UDP-glucose/GDP-mannose dehydrogenase family protein [Gemmatimonadaceae bacterium]|jgi:GDP-mannose 6-dehydrogenase|nr:UDP-glucose/GDP-mannose dehydrogenase family protein [Gemmatimonadaceae bacterium]